MLRIGIADDHDLFLQGMASLINSSERAQVKVIARNGLELINQLHSTIIDVLLLDIDMPRLNGQETLEKVKKDWPNLKVIMLTMHNERSYIKKFSSMPIDGYLLKNTNKEELFEAFDWVTSDKEEKYLSKDLITQMSPAEQEIENEKNPINLLTERELEIVKHTGMEKSIADISEELFISPNTIKTHRRNILRKLNLSNSLGIAKFAIDNGLI